MRGLTPARATKSMGKKAASTVVVTHVQVFDFFFLIFFDFFLIFFDFFLIFFDFFLFFFYFFLVFSYSFLLFSLSFLIPFLFRKKKQKKFERKKDLR